MPPGAARSFVELYKEGQFSAFSVEIVESLYDWWGIMLPLLPQISLGLSTACSESQCCSGEIHQVSYLNAKRKNQGANKSVKDRALKKTTNKKRN